MANARRFCGKNGHVVRVPGRLIGFAGLRAYRAVRKRKISPQVVLQEKQIMGIFGDSWSCFVTRLPTRGQKLETFVCQIVATVGKPTSRSRSLDINPNVFSFRNWLRLTLEWFSWSDCLRVAHPVAGSSLMLLPFRCSEEVLSQHRYGWPMLFSVFTPVGKTRESAIPNCSGLNPKGPGLLLYAMRPCWSIK
jgi:hypothetical protein